MDTLHYLLSFDGGGGVRITGIQGMLNRLVNFVAIGKSVAGATVKGSDISRWIFFMQLAYQKLLKQVVKAVPSTTIIEGNQKQVYVSSYSRQPGGLHPVTR